MSSCKLDKSRPFVHEKYRKLAMKKDLRSASLWKKCYKRCLLEMELQTTKVLHQIGMFFNTLTTYDGQMKREYTSDSHFQDLL
jgi:hypothetical protein